MMYGATVTAIADPRTVPQPPGLRPTAWGGVPRMWEKIKAGLESRASPTPPQCPRRREQRCASASGSTSASASSAGPRRADRGARYFDALGVPILEGWGLSETSCCVTINPPGAVRFGTCGPALDGIELKLAPDGELLVRGPIVMAGYRGEPAMTAMAIDGDGWLHTGDIATSRRRLPVDRRPQEGDHHQLGRQEHVAREHRGRLKAAHPLIGQAVAIGDRRPYVVALLVLDPDVAGRLLIRPRSDGASVPRSATLGSARCSPRPSDRQPQALARRADQELRGHRRRLAARRRRADADDEAAPADRAKYAAEIDALYSWSGRFSPGHAPVR